MKCDLDDPVTILQVNSSEMARIVNRMNHLILDLEVLCNTLKKLWLDSPEKEYEEDA